MNEESQASARRQLILHCAEELLQHYGYAKTTVADIARQAGVGVGTVYLEFASKDEIIAALAEHRHSSVLEAMREAASTGGSYADRLAAMLDERVARFVRYAQQGQHGRDMVTCGCPAVGMVHAQYRVHELGLLTELLEQASAAQEFAVSDAPRTARIVLLLVDQLMDHPEHLQDPDERRRCTRLATRLVLDGLRCRPT